MTNDRSGNLDVLDDAALLDRESIDRAEFFRLERFEPQGHHTSFRAGRGCTDNGSHA